jgi:pyruvate formate-lyase activating enzyme-like uncharacterized protein
MSSISDVNLCKLKEYDKVFITGGEPMLYPARVRMVVDELREQNPDQKVYLYTTLASPALLDMAHIFDGIHFTLHAPHTIQDTARFEAFQHCIEHLGGTYRLYIDPAIEHTIPIKPSVWSRVEVKPWIPEGDCPLPEGEDLLELAL